MATTPSQDSRIENYLARVRVALRGLPEGEIDDIQRELRSHVIDLAGNGAAGVDSALASLGDPVKLAKTYRAENQMARAECSQSPLVILQALRHTTRSGLGRITVTALYFFGYSNMGVLWAAVIEKVLAPSRGGLWYVPGEWSSITLIISGTPPPGSHELLGWWLVPIAAIAGWIAKVVTDRIAQWWIGRFRRQKEARGA